MRLKADEVPIGPSREILAAAVAALWQTAADS
jgi:hypothetical protein